MLPRVGEWLFHRLLVAVLVRDGLCLRADAPNRIAECSVVQCGAERDALQGEKIVVFFFGGLEGFLRRNHRRSKKKRGKQECLLYGCVHNVIILYFRSTWQASLERLSS